MKTIPPVCPEPETGAKYWRSLDQLAETPEFQQWVEREFPAGASEFTDPVSRRNFVKIMSASFLLAGLGATGCRRPEEHFAPFGKMPEGYVHGVSQYFATAMPTRTGAIPLVVRSHEGRPVKIEGNPQHPFGISGTDVYAQASVLHLYDPDRATRYALNGNSATREAAVDALAEVSARYTQLGGKGLAFLLDKTVSPTRLRLQQTIQQKMPNARWYAYEAVDFDTDRQAATMAFGKPVRPFYNFDKAEVILSLDCDFLSCEEDTVRAVNGFAKNRKITSNKDSLNRLYVVEALMSLTGANADHRLRTNASAIPGFAAQLASAIIDKGNISDKWFAECAKDLQAHAGKSIVVAGHRQPLAVHMLALAMNQALGNIGQTVLLHPVPSIEEGTIEQLTEALKTDQVETLVMVNVNPVYNAPSDLAWLSAQKKAKQVIRLAYYEDETFANCTWHFPMAHYLESWGDARTSDGTVVPIQPLIEPLFGGFTEVELLARIAGVNPATPYEVVRETFELLTGAKDENAWRKFLHDGFLANSGYKPESGQFNPAAAAQARSQISNAPAASKDKLEVIFQRDSRMDDGRYNNNGWLMEMPDPVTKMTWENVVLMSLKTATDLGLRVVNEENGKLVVPMVKVDLGGQHVEGPAWVQPGMADNTLSLGLGYGRWATGRIGTKSGFNAYILRNSKSLHLGTGAKVSALAATHSLSCTQNHWVMEGRPVVREANLEQYKKHPHFVKGMNMEAPPVVRSLYPNPLDPEKEKTPHQWGMAIDLNACVGCSACVIACQSENNVPIVGKEMVGRAREMHWLRIDRYFAGPPSDPQMVNQPMFCQHCESAPCESVCPVNATVHDEEGLNLMAYNRCVGTRYCSNNCPYKVRRFNFFDYNRRPLDKLKQTPLLTVTDGEWEMSRWYKSPERGSRPDDEWQLTKLVKNPDVSVRMRGVMEKCTFCVQRIEAAKITQKVKAGASGDVEVKDGTFTTACAQACPAGAIVFGNIKDPNSHVSKLKALDRNYSVLEFLLTKPRLTYLARVRNPNPNMPGDFVSEPASMKEFSEKNHTDPLEEREEEHNPAEHPEKTMPNGAHAPKGEKGAH